MTPYRVIEGDCLASLDLFVADQSVQCCVTSPPYFGLRDYGHEGQIGLEETPDAYVARLVDVFREVRRVLRDDGTVWLNLGDSYAASGRGGGGGGLQDKDVGTKASVANSRRSPVAGLKEKDIIGIPWRVAFALQADGWYLRQDIIWHKPNPMPESVRDRCTKAHEYVFLLSKSPRYYFDIDSIREPYKTADRKGPRRSYQSGTSSSYRVDGGHVKMSGPQVGLPLNEKGRNRRSVWTVAPKPFKGAHFATFPPALVEPCVLAGCPEGGTVLDPFAGSGTTGVVAKQQGRNFIGCELNPEYAEMARERINHTEGKRI